MGHRIILVLLFIHDCVNPDAVWALMCSHCKPAALRPRVSPPMASGSPIPGPAHPEGVFWDQCWRSRMQKAEKGTLHFLPPNFPHSTRERAGAEPRFTEGWSVRGWEWEGSAPRSPRGRAGSQQRAWSKDGNSSLLWGPVPSCAGTSWVVAHHSGC